MKEWYYLSCKDVQEGVFPGEKQCYFLAYQGSELKPVTRAVPEGLVNEQLRTTQVIMSRRGENESIIEVPIAGTKEKQRFIVPNEGLTRMIEEKAS